MSTKTATKTPTLAERRAELARYEEATKRLQEIEGLIASHRADIARQEAKRDKLAEWGDEKIHIPLPMADVPGYGLLEVEPWRSLRTGAELAADVEAQAQHLRATIADLEAEAAQLQKV